MAREFVLIEVKICGLCSAADARMASAAGAAYGGVILAPIGPRRQTVESAGAILDGAPGLKRVGVFVDGGAAAVEAVARRLSLDVLQLHGSEDVATVARLREAGSWKVWKAIRLQTPLDLVEALDTWGTCVDGLLVDGWSPIGPGGVGASFGWADVAPFREQVPAGVDLIVAGGLNAANVGRAVRTLSPDIVDVSSGVEESPGRKSATQVREFVQAARAAAGPAPVVRNGSQ